MGLRFRHTFRVLPGVRVNLSRSGLSTSLGVPGATLNLGARGARATLGLPGTGLSYSSHLGGGAASGGPSAPTAGGSAWAEGPATWTPPAIAASDLRRVGSTGAVGTRTSPSLMEFKALLADARAQRREAEADLEETRRELERRRRELRGKDRFLLRWLFAKRVRQLREIAVPEAEAEEARLTAWRDASVVRVMFDETGEAAATWGAVVAAFRRLAASAQIWDITGDKAADRVRERTTATLHVARTPVRFSVEPEATLQVDTPAPHLPNVNGEDVHLYPLMAVTPGEDDFALLAIDDLKVRIEAVRFQESEAPPADALVVGQTWERANKDGSRDRRFADNRQLPICQYGELTLSTDTGLHEAWQVSNWEALLAFGRAWGDHLAAINRLREKA